MRTLPNFQTIIFTVLLLGFSGIALVQAEQTNSTAGSGEKKSAAKLVDASEAAKLIADKKVVVLDVRMPAEFASGHIAGATNLDIYHKDFKTKLAELDKNQAYLVHCAVGMRSAKACKLMSEYDFKTVYDLKGGLNAWKKAGMHLEK